MLSALTSAIPGTRPFYRAVNRLRGFRLHEPGVRRDVCVIGSEYGGWGVDLSTLSPESVVYCVGVGEDITFDLGLIATIGCAVHAFDPTPVAVRWIAGQALPNELHFHPIGLGARDEDVDFFFPPKSDWHSFSAAAEPEISGAEMIRLPVRRLSSIMTELGHDRLDLLKMDIEGFEYDVVSDIIVSGLRPRSMLIEFHHKSYGISADRTRASVAQLRNYGYEIYWVSDVGRECGFVDMTSQIGASHST